MCRLSSLFFFLVTFIIIICGLKLANSRIECVVNQHPIIFSLKLAPLSSHYNTIHSTATTTIFGNIDLIHEVYNEGGGKLIIIWNNK
jgi:hypothetical protein